MKINILLLLIIIINSITGKNNFDASMDYNVSQQKWKTVDKIINNGINEHGFPGAIAIVGNKSDILLHKSYGYYTYNKNIPMKKDTIFDLASVTKIVATTTSIMSFYQRGELNLNDNISKYLGNGYNVNGKDNITVLNCLLHNSGYYPDPIPNFSSMSFGCPATLESSQPVLNFDCRGKIWHALLNQKLQNPVGVKYVYSDLSMITLMFVAGKLAKDLNYVQRNELGYNCLNGGEIGIEQCYFDVYITKILKDGFNMTHTGFITTDKQTYPSKHTKYCAPTWNDTKYRHKQMQGQVSDENAYASGGISGHAGLFSNSYDLIKYARKMLYATENGTYINKTTIDLFSTEYNQKQSSRALGFNTNDPDSFDYGWYNHCGTLGSKTYMHDGYTGTEICLSKEKGIFTILLTNRVYPDRKSTKIGSIRKEFNTAVVSALKL